MKEDEPGKFYFLKELGIPVRERVDSNANNITWVSGSQNISWEIKRHAMLPCDEIPVSVSLKGWDRGEGDAETSS